MDIHLKENDFEEIVSNNSSVVLDFYADWCGPCQVLLPTIENLAEEFDGQVTIKKVNVDENKALAQKFGVRSIPTLIYFSKGKEVNRSAGVQPESTLRNQINLLQSA